MYACTTHRKKKKKKKDRRLDGLGISIKARILQPPSSTCPSPPDLAEELRATAYIGFANITTASVEEFEDDFLCKAGQNECDMQEICCGSPGCLCETASASQCLVGMAGYTCILLDDNGENLCCESNSDGQTALYSDCIGYCGYNDLTTSSQWAQRGQSIFGYQEDDFFADSVAVSRSGDIMAAGAWVFGNDRREDSGYVRVFSYISGEASWRQLGSNIIGEPDERFGYSVALSEDGTILAVGCTDSSKVKMFRLNKTVGDWEQFGAQIESTTYSFGDDVALSGDGEIVAVGASYDNDAASWAGVVRIYNYDASTNSWPQMGEDVNGQSEGEQFGGSVAISNDGFVLAVGATNDQQSKFEELHPGIVRVYKYVGYSWTQLGDDLIGMADEDLFGAAVSLSYDGSIVAVGAPGYSVQDRWVGQVNVYRYEAAKWIKLGNVIEGIPNEAGGLGSSISLSRNGEIVAAGASQQSNRAVSFDPVGAIRIFRLNTSNDEWEQQGLTIYGKDPYGYFGSDVSLSAAGDVFVVGAMGVNLTGMLMAFQLGSDPSQ